MLTVPAFLSARAMRRLNVFFAVWAACWIGIAVYTAHEVASLRTLSHTVVKAGVATESTGQALAAISHLPFVGGRIGNLAAQAVAAGASARVSGAATRRRSTGSRCSSGSRSRSSRPSRCSRSTCRSS